MSASLPCQCVVEQTPVRKVSPLSQQAQPVLEYRGKSVHFFLKIFGRHFKFFPACTMRSSRHRSHAIASVYNMLIMACHKHVMQTRQVSLGVDPNQDSISVWHTAVPRTCVAVLAPCANTYMYGGVLVRTYFGIGATFSGESTSVKHNPKGRCHAYRRCCDHKT